MGIRDNKAIDREALLKRADDIKRDGSLNGMDYALVEIISASSTAIIQVYFLNSNQLGAIALENAQALKTRFVIAKKGSASGQDEMLYVSTAVIPPGFTNRLDLTLSGIGGYYTYTLNITGANFDPFFNSLEFKFRPGCFHAGCAPRDKNLPKAEPQTINYLAKDFDSFKHTMIAAMQHRVPGWEPTSEADLDITLLELFCAAADELSDFQDRVMNEAYLSTARKRISIARHARLMDYHIHQGNQATGVAILNISGASGVADVSSLRLWNTPEISKQFCAFGNYYLDYALNSISIYTWNQSISALQKGCTSADLLVDSGNAASTLRVCNNILNGNISRLLIQEEVNPATGNPAGRDKNKRQILNLVQNAPAAEIIHDTLKGCDVLRVYWEQSSALQYDYCAFIDSVDLNATENDVSLFYGNIVDISQGGLLEHVYHTPDLDTLLYIPEGDCRYQISIDNTGNSFVICDLPKPLLYSATPVGGVLPPKTTLQVKVVFDGTEEIWDEKINLINSGFNDLHFCVETDEERNSRIRFGNGINGRSLPESAQIHVRYQSGYGPEGNTGADTLTNYSEDGTLQIDGVYNPLPIFNGRGPEPVSEIIRRAPEAYRYKQFRAVTLADYAARAEEIPEVSKAAAQYSWAGSWRCVRVSIDPKGGYVLDDTLREKIARRLEPVKLMGDDIEIRPPRFVPVDIEVSLCIHPLSWPEDVELQLRNLFSDGYLDTGKLAFFHPDRWSFGRHLRAVEIIGAIQKVRGVDHVISVTMRRVNRTSGTSGLNSIIEVRSNEIIQVKNDMAHAENGTTIFDIQGGKV